MNGRRGASGSLRILVVATFDGTNADVIADYLFAFRAHSRHRYFYLFDGRLLGRGIDLSSFDVILVFWSVQLLGPDLPARSRELIRRARAAKVLFLQDEYRDVRATNAVMAELGVRLMFTCVAEKDYELFYPRALVPSLESTVTVLPGYVPDRLASRPLETERSRAWDVGYRSRELPFYLGDLAREKRTIGERFQRIAREEGLTSNISVREADRLYGRRWNDFLENSRCVLGTASGASVVDFTGEIRRQCERHLVLHPGASYEEVRRLFFAGVDGKAVIETASPRIFEAAAHGCVMVQHEGDYAGLLEPDRHYIQVRRDYSNVDEVVAKVRDRGFCRQLVRNAHADLVASGRYGYRAFVSRFDSLLEAHGLRGKAGGTSPAAFHLGACLRHGQNVLPLGDGFVFTPSRAWLGAAVRALAPEASGPLGPFLARLGADPVGAISRAVAVGRLAVTTPVWRRVFAAFLRERAGGGAGSLAGLLDEIDKLEVVRLARAGQLRSEPPFGVEVRLDPEGRALLLTSVPSGVRPGAVPAKVGEAFGARGVAEIVWDHTAVGRHAVVLGKGGRERTVWVGTTGVRRLGAMAALCGRSPEAAAALLAALDGERSVVAHRPPSWRQRGGGVH